MNFDNITNVDEHNVEITSEKEQEDSNKNNKVYDDELSPRLSLLSRLTLRSIRNKSK